MERTHQVSRHHTRLIISAQMPMFLLRRVRSRLAHRDKSQSPEFTVGIDEKRTFVDKRSRPNL